MIEFRRPSPAEIEVMLEKARRPKAEARAPALAAVRPKNVQQILDLGNVIYFTFRGRAYGIPPLGWRTGQTLHLIWTEAVGLGQLTDENADRYYQLIGQLPAILWRHCFPCGKLRRVFRRLFLFRNPFRQATERELVELAAFFLGCRSTSSIGVPPATPPTAPRISFTKSQRFANGSRHGSTPRGSR